jgi:hypothetical protein
MIMYRIECPRTRSGPWTVERSLRQWIHKIHGHDPYDGPSVERDCNPAHGNYRCGVRSFKELRKWFSNSHLEGLAEDGWVLAEYETKTFWEGSWQVAADTRDMDHIKDHSPLIALKNYLITAPMMEEE